MADNVSAGQRRWHSTGSQARAYWLRTIRLVGVLVLALGPAGVLAAPAARASPAAPAHAWTRPGLRPHLWRPGGLGRSGWLPSTVGPVRTAGRTWTVQPTPNPLRRPNGVLLSGSCTSPSACTAVGSRFNGAGVTVTLAERWNGKNWRVQATPNPAGATSTEFTGVWCTSALACVATGDYVTSAGSIRTLAERWDGTRWRIQPTPNPAHAAASGFFGLSCTSARACTATGDYNFGIGASRTLAERWNGTSWRIQATPNPAGSQDSGLFGVSCGAARACTAAGAYVTSTGTTVTLGGAWDGMAWHIQATPNPAGAVGSEFFGVSCSAPNACTAVGSSGTSTGASQSLAERWNGTRWTIQVTPTPAIRSGGTNSELTTVSCSAARACTAAGAYAVGTGPALTLAEVWDGTSWRVQATPNPAGNTGSGFFGVSCSSARSCTAVGSSSHGASPVAVPLAEAWNGTRWRVAATPSPVGPADSTLRAVSCVSARSCTAVGSYSRSAAVTVTLAEAWNGTRWRIQATPNPAHTVNAELLGVSCPTPRACTGVGTDSNGHREKVLAERWNGRRWRIQATPVPAGAANSELDGVSCSSARACTAVGRYNTRGAQSLALAERWNGRRWSIQATPAPPGTTTSQLSGASCASARSCTAVGSYATAVGKTKALAEGWNGTSWHLQRVLPPAGAQVVVPGAVSCSSARACTAVGIYFTQHGPLTLALRWNGTNWRAQAIPNQPGAERNELNGVSCASAGSCTAVGDYAATDSSPTIAFAEAWNGTRWKLETAPGPAGTIISILYGVSCTTAACTGVGYDVGRSGIQVTLAETTSR